MTRSHASSPLAAAPGPVHGGELGRWCPAVEPGDRQAWFRAGNLEALGECAAAWLSGTLSSRPGYVPGRGPDPETTPLIPQLAGYCRAGLVTTCSQPGVRDPQRGLLQRAAVVGNCRGVLGEVLTAHLQRLGMIVVARHVAALAADDEPDGESGPRRTIPVTYRHGRVVTTIAAPATSVVALRPWRRATLGADARADLEQSWVLAAIDPQWGPSLRLWAALDDALGLAARARPGPAEATSVPGRPDTGAGDPSAAGSAGF